MNDVMFERYLKGWGLKPDGVPRITESSYLMPVRFGAIPAMLKVAVSAEEIRGNGLMSWWNGKGAAPVLAYDRQAILLLRALNPISLSEMSLNDDDDRACQIICAVIDELHYPQAAVLPELMPLSQWFAGLAPAAKQHGGILIDALSVANQLLTTPQGEVVLHGDIHHENILDFGELGWRAIDPKGLIGERGFDYANVFCNPLGCEPSAEQFHQRLALISRYARLEPRRLLMWILAWCGLSASWFLEDGGDPKIPLAVARLAQAKLTQA
ncbi:Aminoglycoside/hydroxyurea antibiotic resistance kinase [Pragia fontium]|uniref:3'-kinase n=1 Tax=Pragia fontium TaxID=82985 RepID=A0ABQ5LMW6_9GAMM|nr:3'-kinase [Pragia fontium]SUB83388.1 Aminoglycoside/hydroxyurea antibiotic resistance kinase [Pragia fontium]